MEKALLIEKLTTLFSLAGFSVRRNIMAHGLRADILATKDLEGVQKDFTVLCICVHEQSEMHLRKVIGYCTEKNKLLQAEKILLAVDGIEVMGEDRQMAELNGIEILAPDNIEQLLKDMQRKKGDGVKKFLAVLDIDIYSDPKMHAGTVKQTSHG